jgi:hypothetical protein
MEARSMSRTPAAKGPLIEVQRVQTGVRMEKRLIKVLKALAEYLDISLGDLLEGIVLHTFDYGLELDSRASHRLTESGGEGKSA